MLKAGFPPAFFKGDSIMELFTINRETCTRCGSCVEDCPAGIIELRENSDVPSPVTGADELCILCGHCVAVCPYGALSHRNMPVDECPVVHDELLPGRDHVEHFLRFRRSIRMYKAHNVDRDTIAKLIDIARFSPSGHNSQSSGWIVVYDREKVRQIAGMVIDWMNYTIQKHPQIAAKIGLQRVVAAWDSGKENICRDAPHLLCVHAGKENAIAQFDSAITLTYLELAAPSFGLGTCWAGFVTAAAQYWPPLQEIIGLPEGDKVYGAMMIGYPKYKYHRLPLRNEARITWH